MPGEVATPSAPPAAPLLRVSGLVKHYRTRRGLLRAVDGVSFDVRPGETLGLVGESGCGKSTLARTLLRLEDADGGEALLHGQDLLKLSGGGLRRARRSVQMVFQDPFGSLNPRLKVGDVIAEPWRTHPDVVAKPRWRDEVAALLTRVGLPESAASRYPHEFSGGQRQRIGLARALALRPEVLVLDEPVSALDVSVQAQVLNLLADLQDDLGLAYVFIAHDLSVVRHVAHRVAVMYLGRIVETGDVEEVYESPAHPYTRALLSAAPTVDLTGAARRGRMVLTGEVPSPVSPPSGCHFRPRCWRAEARCAESDPQLIQFDNTTNRHAACHFAPVGPPAASPTPGSSPAR